MDVLKYGPDAEIVAPLPLREEMKILLQLALSGYAELGARAPGIPRASGRHDTSRHARCRSPRGEALQRDGCRDQASAAALKEGGYSRHVAAKRVAAPEMSPAARPSAHRAQCATAWNGQKCGISHIESAQNSRISGIPTFMKSVKR